jgi:hypothetical protein
LVDPRQKQQLQELLDSLRVWGPPIPAAPASEDIPPALRPLPSPGPNPFGDPPKPPHEVAPPRGNPYNVPGYFEEPYDRSFIVTNNLSRQTEDQLSGGLLGRLLALQMQQSQVQPIAESNGRPPQAPDVVPSRRLVAWFER